MMRKLFVATASLCILTTVPTSPSEGTDENSSRNIHAQGNDDHVTLETETYEEVPVSGGAPASNAGDDNVSPSIPDSGVSVRAASPSPAPGRWVCIGGKPDRPGGKIGQLCTRAPQEEAPADPPAPAGPAPAPVVVTAHDVATLIIDGSGITLQPPGTTILLHMPLIAHTNPTTRALSTTVGTTPIDIEATPTTYTWNWGDGTTTTTTDPGHPYPNHTITHQYTTTNNNTTITLTTTWTARYRPTGTTTWTPVTGYITTTQTTPPLTIQRLIPYLTDDAQEHHNH